MEARRGAETDAPPHAELQPAQVRACLENLLSSPAFSGSPRRAQLLRYLVERTLAGDGERINEYAIGLDVFGKPASFDPRLESIVRTELARLRQKLRDYYVQDGLNDAVQIDIPPRSYVPGFRLREPAATLAATPRPPSVLPRRQWWIVSAAILALAVIALTIWLLRSTPAHPLNSVAVLPFVNLSPDHRGDYLADGITEELTNNLAQSGKLRVVARTSAWLFKGKAADIREIGRRLNVENAVEGSIESEGDQIRITAQMNRTSDGYHVWSRSYKASAGDTAAIEDEIAQSIIAVMRGGERKAVRPPILDSTKNPEAHDLYLRAYELALHHPDSYRQSVALFQQALRADPAYVNAYIGLARVHISLLHVTQETPQQAIPPTRAALEKALQLDPSCGEARGMLADLIATYDWNWPLAESQFRQALAEGAQSTTHSFYGLLLATRGRFREAQAQFRVAEDLDPLGFGPRFNQFFAFYLERNYSEAKRVLQALREMNPDRWDVPFMRGIVAVTEQDCAAANNELEWCARKFPAPVTKIGLALAAACNGQRGQARSYLAEASTPDKAAYTSPYQLALGYAALGDEETALAQLQKSADAKEMQILYLKCDPGLDALRSDPRFIALEKRVGLLD